MDAILRSSIHIVACIRTKTAWEIVDDERGRKKPVKLGLKPDQRDGFDYEFTTVLDVSVEGHLASSYKDRSHVFDGRAPELMTEGHGAALRAWLDNAPAAPPIQQPVPVQPGAQIPTVQAPAGAQDPRVLPPAVMALLEEMARTENPTDLKVWGAAAAARVQALGHEGGAAIRAAYMERLALFKVHGSVPTSPAAPAVVPPVAPAAPAAPGETAPAAIALVPVAEPEKPKRHRRTKAEMEAARAAEAARASAARPERCPLDPACPSWAPGRICVTGCDHCVIENCPDDAQADDAHPVCCPCPVAIRTAAQARAQGGKGGAAAEGAEGEATAQPQGIAATHTPVEDRAVPVADSGDEYGDDADGYEDPAHEMAAAD